MFFESYRIQEIIEKIKTHQKLTKAEEFLYLVKVIGYTEPEAEKIISEKSRY